MITLDELRAFNDAAFNRAVAEAAGWTHIDYDSIHDDEDGWIYKGTGQPPGGNDHTDPIPDYANDLNASFSLCEGARSAYVESDPFSFDGYKARLCVPLASSDVVSWQYDAQESRAARAIATAWYASKLAQS